MQKAHFIAPLERMSMSDRQDTDPVEVVDEAGKVVGTVTRQEMRQRRLPHRCVYILVFNSRGELFTHLRTDTKDVYPGHWDVCVGGVLAPRESFDDGAWREGCEELGVILDPEPLFPFRYEDAATVVHAMVYGVRHDGPFRLQPEEIVIGEFLPVAEVWQRVQHEPFCPDGLAVLRAYQERQ
jgi:isopentenyldiphosphate isomerase